MANLYYTFLRWQRARIYNRVNKKAKEGQVIMVGDSIIDLYNLDKHYGDLDVKVYNRGISGDTTTELIKRLEKNVLTAKPKKVILLIGTNDIDHKMTEDDTINNIDAILKRIKASGVDKVYVESLYPINPNKDKLMVGVRTNDHILRLNERLVDVAKANDVTYINVHDSLVDANGEFDPRYTFDGLHPNAEGYDIVTDVVRPYVVD